VANIGPWGTCPLPPLGWERLVISNEEVTDGRARVTADEERVLYVACDWQVVVTSRELC